MSPAGTTDPAFLGWLIAGTAAAAVTPARWRGAAMVAVTVAFLAVADARSLAVLTALTAIVLAVSRVADPRLRSRLSPLAMAATVAVLVGFKALDPERGVVDGGLVVPLGLSFYTLRCLHVLIECYLEELPPVVPGQLLRYLFFLPTIVAGPVHRYPPFAAETPTRPDRVTLSRALERILYGYAKIVLISTYLLSDKIFPAAKGAVANAGAAYEYLDCLDFGLNLYFQFSGYSDVAIAFALLAGHRVMENFDWPLLRTNLVDFWRSWHISVTSWCREYVFTGVFALSRQRWLGLVATMLAVGVWHGLTLNFVAWGLYHGFGLVATQAWTASILKRRQFAAPANGLLAAVGWFLTFNYVIVGFAWTKEPDLASSLAVFRTLIAGGSI
jgi:alginate O-acetyltransferase complex protein AlgI